MPRFTWVLALCSVTILSPVLAVNGQETSDETHLGRVLDAINQRFDDADKRIDQRFDAINQRFDAIDKRLDSIETRLNEVESKVDHASGQLSMAMWFFMALIAFAGVYAALRKRKGEARVAGGKKKNPYEDPQPKYVEGTLSS